MVTPLIIWGSIASIVILIAIINLIYKAHKLHSDSTRRMLIIEIGEAHDEFWAPGDIKARKDPYNMIDEFDEY